MKSKYEKCVALRDTDGPTGFNKQSFGTCAGGVSLVDVLAVEQRSERAKARAAARRKVTLPQIKFGQ